MDKQQLQKLLQEKYNRDEWNSLLSDIFPAVNLLKEPEKIEVNNKNVKSFHQTGLVRLKDGKNLAVFEVILDDGINLLRNRVALRNLTTRYIDEANNHGVLVVYDQGKENYRFTFVSQESGFNEKGEWATFETASKRFTYILGEGESCRTASERLALLASKKTSAKLDDVIDAFSVEQLSKEFFTKYKAHYQAFVDYLVGSNFKKSMFSGDDKAIRDFVKKMLGRIVFLYFLQKKGWLGASDESYSDGDKNFMQTFWESSGKADTFYSQHLTRLFFQGLNATDREKEFFEMADGKKVKIPYLNGGLFDKDRNEPELLTFPSNLFNSLFSFFAEYNFTIDENDPEEHEVGIDPEMLGHIFENLLEDNKDKGAYYTPKEIVQYMTQESLIEYLKTGLEKKNQVLSDDEGNALKYFVRYKLKGDEIPKEDLKVDVARFYQNQLRFIQTYGSQVNRLLDDVKICDPAIGSGAFPMGLLNEIYHCKLILNNTYSLEERAKVKRHIIENSIYGVDIEKGAVDIARLRFWLSLIVDEEKPSPLPNLDYKIVPGDSLVSRFEDEVIDIDWNVKHNTGGLFEQDLFDNKTKLLTAIFEKQKKYFEPSQINKEKLNLEIRNLKLDILINQLRLMIAQKGGNDSYNGTKKSKKQLEAELLIKGWKRTLSKLEVLKQKPEKPFNHFDWKLDFPELLNPILNETIKGFDIIIGNPPYINANKLKKLLGKKEYEELKSKYETAKGTIDIYILFFELGVNYLKDNGILTFITPNRYLSASYGTALREYFYRTTLIKSIADYSAIRVFKEASTYPIVTIIQKDKTKQTTPIKIYKHSTLNRPPKSWENPSKDLTLLPEYLWGFLINEKIGIVKRLIAQSEPLASVGKINATSTAKEADDFHILINENIGHKLINTGTIDSYTNNWGLEYLTDKGERYLFPRIDINSSVISLNRKKLYNSPKIILAKIALRAEAFYDKEGEFASVNTNCIHTFSKDYLPEYVLCWLNSKVYHYMFECFFDGLRMSGGFLLYSSPNLRNTYIKKIAKEEQFKFKILADYCSFILAHPPQIDEFVPNKHLVETFEEVIDALFMELFFKQDFENEGIQFMKYVERDLNSIEGSSENEKIRIIKKAYQSLREKENKIRNNLKLMDTRLSEIVMPIKSII